MRRELRGPTQGHLASKGQNCVSNPGLLIYHWLFLSCLLHGYPLWFSLFLLSEPLGKDVLEDVMLFAFCK